VSGQLHAMAALFPSKEQPIPIEQELGWVPEPVWTRWRRENIPDPAGNRTPFVQHTAYTLYRASYYAHITPLHFHRRTFSRNLHLAYF